MLKPETWNCSYAAPPDDIHWENLTNSRVMWYLKSGFIHGLLLILVIFLTTPKHAAEHFDDFLHLTLGKNVRKSIMPCPFTSLWPGTKTWTSPKHFGTWKGQGISFWLFNWLYGQNIQIFLNIVILTFWKILEIPTIVIERNLQIGVK